MQKILSIAILSVLATTSFVFARNDDRIATSTKPEAQLNVACIQTALDKRDTAIIAAHNTYNTSITNALTARKDGLKTAWAKPTRAERREARKTVWDTFRTSHKGAHEAFRTIRKSSWATFDTDMKACGVSKEAHGESAHVADRAMAF